MASARILLACLPEYPRRGVVMRTVFEKVGVWFDDDERGASMVEYALLVVLIAIVAFVAVQLAGNQLSTLYSTIADSVTNAAG